MTHSNIDKKVPEDVFQSTCNAYGVEVIEKANGIAQRRILGRVFWIQRRAVFGSESYFVTLKTGVKNKFDAVNKKLNDKIKESRWYKARRHGSKLGKNARTGKLRTRFKNARTSDPILTISSAPFHLQYIENVMIRWWIYCGTN